MGNAQGATQQGGRREKNRYRATLNLPRTRFPMKANLVQNEPRSLARWERLGLYERLRERSGEQARGRFVFHDGPPYANGSIHLGHLLNKCLKDFVVRSRQMGGWDCPFVPGWDCHGLPIEHKVMTELVESGKIERLRDLEPGSRHLAIRGACEKYARKYQKLQASQMQRLLTLADYAHPYLTMDPSYEGAVLETLAEMVGQGLVYRALKPVHWSIANETALAEAELEYMEREDPSVFVDFEARDGRAVFEAFGLSDEDVERLGLGARPSFMIWTTTPWTLPANLAIAVQPRFVYALVRMDGNVTVLARDLVEKVASAGGAQDVEVLAEAPGERLIGLGYCHPFIDEVPVGEGVDRVWTIVGAEYVTLEDGTGLVHTAPGHGSEDFQTGIREGIAIYCPVREDGTYDERVPSWLRGVDVFRANELIVERLRESGHLFHHHAYRHSYPHDWRSKTPVIFRATEQWFIGVDTPMREGGRTLRELALEQVASPEAVRFVPEWGRNRLRGMLENRPDWCISRQRSWGLPIPAFFTDDGRVLLTRQSVRSVARVFREEGSDAWFRHDAAHLLRHYDPGEDPDVPAEVGEVVRERVGTLRKCEDILDVWFESGSSWNAVMRERSRSEECPEGCDYPVDLYLEGSDQHRGWFQSSLLAALGATRTAPFRSVLTHGFMVDRDGLKLSKSKGDTIESLFERHGADVLRWWVSSLAYEGDMKVDEEFFRLAGESYRKVRNTLRFMLGNVGDTGVAEARRRLGEGVDPCTLEAWVLERFGELHAKVREAYLSYRFRDAHAMLYDFCNDTLSSVYLAAIKDRLYCDPVRSERARRARDALCVLGEGLCRLLAPILCHTADEAYRALVGAGDDDIETCVHLLDFGEALEVRADERWARVMRVRDDALIALERAKEQGLENPLDAGLVVGDDGTLEAFDLRDIGDLCGVSLVSLEPGGEGVRVEDLRERYPRCERSWKRGPDVRERSDGGMLSDRDAEAVGV